MRLTIVIAIILAVGSNNAFGQDIKRTYEVIASGNVNNLEMYHLALSQKDLDPYRFVDAERIIKFESGVEIKLLSAIQLEQQYGRFRDRSIMNQMGSEPMYPWYWELNEQGGIIDKRLLNVE